METDPRLSELMVALSFTAEDLAANRTGVLGEGQIKRLRRQSWLFLSLFVFVGVAFAALFVVSGQERPVETTGLLAAFFIVVFMAIGLFGYWLARRGLRTRVVKCYVGKVTIARGSNFNWLLNVAGQSLMLSMDIRMIVDPDVEFRVYATPLGREVLSLEPA